MVYVKKKRKPVGDARLATWAALNSVVARLGFEDCVKLIKVEKSHRNRLQFLQRLHSRMGRTRRAKERRELVKGAK